MLQLHPWHYQQHCVGRLTSRQVSSAQHGAHAVPVLLGGGGTAQRTTAQHSMAVGGGGRGGGTAQVRLHCTVHLGCVRHLLVSLR